MTDHLSDAAKNESSIHECCHHWHKARLSSEDRTTTSRRHNNNTSRSPITPRRSRNGRPTQARTCQFRPARLSAATAARPSEDRQSPHLRLPHESSPAKIRRIATQARHRSGRAQIWPAARIRRHVQRRETKVPHPLGLPPASHHHRQSQLKTARDPVPNLRMRPRLSEPTHRKKNASSTPSQKPGGHRRRAPQVAARGGGEGGGGFRVFPLSRQRRATWGWKGKCL